MAEASPLAVATEEPCIRTYFYTGGRYVDNGNGQHIFRDQMYVEKLVPVGGSTQETPIILIHGAAQTGTNFLNKPDGGRGWASDFLQQGYEIYIIDQAYRGRSAWQPTSLPVHTISAEQLQQRFTATAKYKMWPQAAKHTQWPGSGLMGDPVFDAFYASNIQYESSNELQQTAMQVAGAALLDRIGKPAILVGHSQGGSMPIVIADARPQLTKALILLEPRGPPFREGFNLSPSQAWGVTDIPITYSPPVKDPSELVQSLHAAHDADSTEGVLQAEDPPPRRLVNLAGLPILLVTAEASYHAQYDHHTVEFLRQAGCHKTEHIELGKMGIRGNGHMFFLEKNSQQIQNVLHHWIQRLAPS